MNADTEANTKLLDFQMALKQYSFASRSHFFIKIPKLLQIRTKKMQTFNEILKLKRREILLLG